MKIIDISVPATSKLPVWPSGTPLRSRRVSKADGKKASNETRLDLHLHTGTHLDAPLHFLPNGDSIDKADLGTFFGPALVVHFPKAKAITALELQHARIPKGTKRILCKTSNGAWWRTKRFNKDFVGLTADAADWLVRQGVVLVGVDYLSVAAFTEVVPVHHALLKKKVALLEGIDLSRVKAGRYELACAPLFIPGAEAAPTRAVLIQSGS